MRSFETSKNFDGNLKNLLTQNGSVLTDVEIENSLKNGEIDIKPFSKINLQPASYDVRLGYTFIRFKENSINEIDLKDTESYKRYFLDKNILEKILNSKETTCYENDVIKVYVLKTLKDVEKGFLIKPKEFILATTIEEVYLSPNISAFITGRSSIGRLGLFIENAGWIDSGFRGQITLELFNANNIPIRVYPNMRVAQLVFLRNIGECRNPYNGKYQGQKETTISKIIEDYELSLENFEKRFKENNDIEKR